MKLTIHFKQIIKPVSFYSVLSLNVFFLSDLIKISFKQT